MRRLYSPTMTLHIPFIGPLLLLLLLLLLWMCPLHFQVFFIIIIDGTLPLRFTAYKAKSEGKILRCGTKESCIRLKAEKHVKSTHNTLST